VFGDDNVAWYAGDCIFSATIGGKALNISGRMTAVLNRSGGRWLFAMSHFSVPYEEQKTGQPWPEPR